MNAQTSLFLLLSLLIALLLSGCNGDTTSEQSAQPSSATSTEGAEAPAIDLHAAVVAGEVDAVRQHILAGSNLNEAEPFAGSSPLISAAIFGQTQIAQLLIDAGAEIDFTNLEGSTALHSAAFFCRPDILDALLAAGADKTIVNNYGSTAYDTVAGPFNEVKPFYDAIGPALAPMGLTLDYDHLRATRPQIAATLQ